MCGSQFGGGLRFPSDGSEQNYLAGHSCDRFPYQALLQAKYRQIIIKTNKLGERKLKWPIKM